MTNSPNSFLLCQKFQPQLATALAAEIGPRSLRTWRDEHAIRARPMPSCCSFWDLVNAHVWKFPQSYGAFLATWWRCLDHRVVGATDILAGRLARCCYRRIVPCFTDISSEHSLRTCTQVWRNVRKSDVVYACKKEKNTTEEPSLRGATHVLTVCSCQTQVG